MKIKSIPCEISGHKGWTIFYGKKLLGFIYKLQDGDFKYFCQTHSDYGPSFYCKVKKEGIKRMIDSGWF